MKYYLDEESNELFIFKKDDTITYEYDIILMQTAFVVYVVDTQNKAIREVKNRFSVTSSKPTWKSMGKKITKAALHVQTQSLIHIRR